MTNLVLSAAVVGARLWPVDGRGWQVLLATVASALIAVLPFLWLYRARLVRRWRTALDAYAAQEIVRDRRSKARPRTSPARAPGSAQSRSRR